MFQALGRFDYTPQDCYAFHEAIEKEIVPILREQAEKRKQALGLDLIETLGYGCGCIGQTSIETI